MFSRLSASRPPRRPASSSIVAEQEIAGNRRRRSARRAQRRRHEPDAEPASRRRSAARSISCLASREVGIRRLLPRDPGLRSSTRLYHDISAAAAIMIRMPDDADQRSASRSRPKSRPSRNAPAKARNTPRQKISSECWPHRIAGQSHARLERRPVARNEPHRHRRQRQEMRKAQDVEIGLVDRIDHLLEPVRHVRGPCREVPGQRDDEREQQIGDRDAERHARAAGAGRAARRRRARTRRRTRTAAARRTD